MGTPAPGTGSAQNSSAQNSSVQNRSALRTQTLRFLVVGVGTLLLDYATYRSMLALGLPISWAKLVGFAVGTTATYLLNRAWTFGARGGSVAVVRFLGLYAVTLVLNLATNALLVHLLLGRPLRIEIAFLVAQAVTSAANFVGLRWLVFRPGPPQPADARAASSRATGTRNGEQDT